MKTLSCCALFALLAVNAFSQGANITIIRERARSVAGQNNARQGAPPPHAPQAATPVSQNAASTVQTNATRQIVAKLQSDLASIKTNSVVSSTQKQALIADLNAAAQSAAKPSQDSINKLANDLASALGGRSLSAAEHARLAQNLVLMLNSGSISLARKQEITDDASSLLYNSSSPGAAANVVADLKLVAMEVQGPAK